MIPSVSVITATWQRHRLLLERCIPSVRAQVYGGPIEQIVVSDGPDPELERLISDGFVRFDALPTHADVAHWGALPRLRGCELAQGDFIAYLDDDNAYRPEHLQLLVAAMVERDADFAFSPMLLHRGPGDSHVLGDPPPRLNHIDTSMLVHRRELLERATWRVAGYACDGDLVERWLAAGATWAFVEQPTVDYYARGWEECAG